MPTYEYVCTECGESLEAVQSFSDDPLTICPSCQGKLRKVFSPVGVVFKGSGFYKTDSRSGGKGSTSNGKDGASKESSAKDSSSSKGTSSSGESAGSASTSTSTTSSRASGTAAPSGGNTSGGSSGGTKVA